MNAVQEDAIRMIQSLPDDCTTEDIHYHLYVREKVLAGSAAIDAGQIVSHEEMQRRVQAWAESSGPIPQHSM